MMDDSVKKPDLSGFADVLKPKKVEIPLERKRQIAALSERQVSGDTKITKPNNSVGVGGATVTKGEGVKKRRGRPRIEDGGKRNERSKIGRVGRPRLDVPTEPIMARIARPYAERLEAYAEEIGAERIAPALESLIDLAEVVKNAGYDCADIVDNFRKVKMIEELGGAVSDDVRKRSTLLKRNAYDESQS